MEMLSNYYSNFIKGDYYSKSNSLVKIRLAADYLEKALECKETEEAYRSLLICYLKLNESEKYEQTLFNAVDSGFTVFYSSVGIFYANSKQKFDKEKSLAWFQKGMNLKDGRSYSELSKLYLLGCSAFKSDRTKGIELLKEGLDLNDPKWNGYFAWALGLAYYEDKRYDEAAELYRKSIDCGYQPANYYYALLFRDGFGVEKDSEKYIEYLMKYLCPESALEMAGIYLLKQIAPEDKELAFIYLDYAAKKGNAVGAMLSAAYLVDSGNYNEKAVYQYLEIAFRNGVTDQNMKDHYEEIEDMFDEKTRKILQELASKYWNMRRGVA